MKSLCQLLFAFWVAASVPGATAETDKRPPNIIVVLSDDVGLSRIGCYGGAPFKTPHLDQLAATGLRFERCYSMPICGPSRSALLTGKYPFRTGAISNASSGIDPEKNPTLANVLRQAGYATCAIGKLGQSAPENGVKGPQRLGFDEFMLWMGRGTPDRYWSPRYFRNEQLVPGRPDEYGPDLTHDFLVDFMKRHRREPFFVYYSAVLAHMPFARTPDSKDSRQLAMDMVAYLDKQMGRLITGLEKLSLRERTLILFTPDNGPMGAPLGTIRGAPMVGRKGDATEGGVREPLIANCPGLVPAGVTCPDLTDFTDFFPTVLELAGVKPPPGLKPDGRSIAPQILGRPGQPRQWVHAQHRGDYFIADHRYKLYGDGRFVDISDSPVAEKPVDGTDETAANARRRLAATLAELRAGVVEDAPVRPPPLKARVPASNAGQAAQLKADLQSLVELKLISSADEWLGRAQYEGEQVAALLVKAANRVKPAANVEQAIAILNREGVISSVACWKEHAVAGQQCAAGTVAKLVNKLVARLKSP